MSVLADVSMRPDFLAFSSAWCCCCLCFPVIFDGYWLSVFVVVSGNEFWFIKRENHRSTARS